MEIVMTAMNKIESITIGRGDAGRYEYQDSAGVVESGENAHRITIEVGLDTQDIYFKHKENAEKYLAK